MQRIWRDVRVAVRALRQQPVFAMGGIAIVALGVGAATAMFTVLNAAFLRPFPYPEANRLVYVWEVSRTGNRMPVAGPNAVDWSRETRLFAQLAYYSNGQAILSGAGDPERVPGAAVSRPFAEALGIAPMLGRWFSPDEARQGGPPVVVLGEGLWRRRFGGDPGIIGQGIRLDGNLATVVGVMPRALAFPVGAALWRPAEPYNGGVSRTAHNWRVLARLAPMVTQATAEREVSALTRRLLASETGGDDFVAASAAVVPFRDQLVSQGKTVLFLLQGAVLLVLLIAAVNLTNLTLARAVRRRGEVGVCLALGARRIDVVRRFATENLVITLVGGATGLLLAAVLRGLLVRWVGRLIPFVKELPVDLRVAAFATGLALIVGLASSIVPALRASAGAVALVASRGGTAPRSSSRLIDGLMAAEVALALILVAGAGLVGKSLWHLSDVDPGFAVPGRTAVLVTLRTGKGSSTPTPEAEIAAYDRFLAELGARPGTISVGATNALPLWTYAANGSAEVEGAASAAGGPPAASDLRIVSPDYFRSLEIPLRRGRAFEAGDGAGSPYVAVVNESFARRYLGAGDPMAHRVRFPGMDAEVDPWASVIGVVGDTQQDGLGTEPYPAIYYSYRQRAPEGRAIAVVVHSSAPAGVVLDDLRGALARLDPGIPFTGRPYAEIVGESLALPRIRSTLLALFAGIALLLSAAGIGAVVAFAVALRTREIGLRIAVGASSRAIVWGGVTRTAGPVLAGLAVGVVGAVLLGRLARTLLFQLTPSDPPTLLGAVGITLGVALVAAYLPARRAARVDPLTALRAE